LVVSFSYAKDVNTINATGVVRLYKEVPLILFLLRSKKKIYILKEF